MVKIRVFIRPSSKPLDYHRFLLSRISRRRKKEDIRPIISSSHQKRYPSSCVKLFSCVYCTQSFLLLSLRNTLQSFVERYISYLSPVILFEADRLWSRLLQLPHRFFAELELIRYHHALRTFKQTHHIGFIYTIVDLAWHLLHCTILCLDCLQSHNQLSTQIYLLIIEKDN